LTHRHGPLELLLVVSRMNPHSSSYTGFSDTQF
jgi:hypothetical protein